MQQITWLKVMIYKELLLVTWHYNRKLLVLDQNTWNQIIVQIFIIKKTWYNNCVQTND